MRRYVLTGGHGVGKSSIISALEQAGEHVVYEAAGALRRAGRARGVPFPEDDPGFESRALGLHLRREARITHTARRVFLDRGAPDHLAYARAGHWQLGDAEVAVCRQARYELGFMIEPPDEGVPTLTRVEAAFCQRLVPMIEEAYHELGIPLVRVPHAPLDTRVQFILDTVRRTSPTTST